MLLIHSNMDNFSTLQQTIFSRSMFVSCLRSRKNFWSKINATPLLSSTSASSAALQLTKFAVIPIASLPLNSLRLKPGRLLRRPSAPIITSKDLVVSGWFSGRTLTCQPGLLRSGSTNSSKAVLKQTLTPKRSAALRSRHCSLRIPFSNLIHYILFMAQLYRVEY